LLQEYERKNLMQKRADIAIGAIINTSFARRGRLVSGVG